MSWTPEQKRAYAIKKSRERRKERRAPRPTFAQVEKKPKPGFALHPSGHRCEPWDILYGEKEHACRLCGRKWCLEVGLYDDGVWKTGAGFRTERFRNYPLSMSMPPPCPEEHIPQRSIKRAVPTGTLGELPPDDLNGQERGKWWVASWKARMAKR